jgi:hypothetical protein
MTLPVWPDGVNYKPDTSGFSFDQAYAAAVVTQFEDGPDRMRRRAFTRIRRMAYRIILDSDAECFAARDFIENALGDGTSRFRMPVRMPGATEYAPRIVYIENAAYKLTESAPTIWALTFTLCVTPAS